MKDGSKFAIDGPQFFELIHDVKKRHASMNTIELSRYPTLNDPESIESAMEGINELESVQEEVEKLSKLIDNASVPIPSNLRRRGMCYARMGKYEDAASDFNKAIKYGKNVKGARTLNLI
jgi:tetratricopeptide (TPR) repeat protein